MEYSALQKRKKDFFIEPGKSFFTDEMMANY